MIKPFIEILSNDFLEVHFVGEWSYADIVGASEQIEAQIMRIGE